MTGRIRILAAIMVLTASAALTSNRTLGTGDVGPASRSTGFEARLLVVASDGDMLAQAYAGKPLGPPAPDVLTVVRLDRQGRPHAAGTVSVRNSVVGPPASLDVTPDGRFALIVETRGSRPNERADAKLADLPPGRIATVVDLRDADHPVVVQRLTLRAEPISVSISPIGTVVMIAYDTSKQRGAPLELFDLVQGRLTNARMPVVPGFGVKDALKNAAFAPDGSLALVYATDPRLSVLKLTAGALVRWGADVPLGPTPFEVRFSPDGRFALVNDMTIPATGTDVRGTVTSIALATGRAADGAPIHRVVSRARTGVLPEGLAISPDGRWVATTNLERTAYASQDQRQGGFASVTLLRLDQQGRLARVGDYPFPGVIPEAAAFDSSSRQLAVAVFDRQPPAASTGSIDFWRIATDFQDPSRAELVPTGVSVPVARGAQSMAVVR